MTEQLDVPAAALASRARRPRGRWLLGASWAYAALVLGALGLIRGVGDGWWFVVVLLLMPRWLFLGPVALLAAASGVRRCFGHWALQGAVALVVAGPLMNVSTPVRRLWTRAPQGMERLRIVTFNVASRPFRGEALRDWLDLEGVDVVCLQEARAMPQVIRAALGGGWHLSRGGSVATRWRIVAEMPKFEEQYQRGGFWTGHLELVRLQSPAGAEFLVGAVHLPTIRYGLYDLRAGQTEGVRRHMVWWRHELERILGAVAGADPLPVLLAGDFNLPADDSTMGALRSHFRFAFEEAGWGYGYTKPSNLPWVRIDHVLAGPEWVVTACRVGPDFGSDHLPLLAEVALPPRATVPPPKSPSPPQSDPPGMTVADPPGPG